MLRNRNRNRNRNLDIVPRTTGTRPSLISRLRRRGYADEARVNHRRGVVGGHHADELHYGTHGAILAPVHHRRRVTLGDKISGAMMRLRGSLTRRPGLKAAGVRRMHGTDGKGSRRVVY